MQKFLEPSRKSKVITITMPWNLAWPVKIFPGIIARLHHTDQKQMGLLKEQCAEQRKAPLRYAGGIWKGDIMIADVEELETMDASEINSKRLNAKEVTFPKQGEFILPIADGRIKILGGDQDLKTSTLIRDHPINSRRKSKIFSWRIRRVSTITTSRLTSGCR